MDWDRVDSVLDRVEPVLLSLAGRFHISQPGIERWRWDEPVITMRWRGADDLRRNIGVHVVSEDEVVTIEVNAWRDEDRDEGKARLRRWEHRPIRNLKITRDKSFDKDLDSALSEAYEIVTGLKVANLKRETPITIPVP